MVLVSVFMATRLHYMWCLFKPTMTSELLNSYRHIRVSNILYPYDIALSCILYMVSLYMKKGLA